MPILSIEIPWDPSIVRIGGFLLTWHGLFTSVAIIVGFQLSLRIARRGGYEEDDWYAIALVAVPSGIVGARLLFVWENWDFYGGNPGRIIALTEGGITLWGAILGGLVGALAFGIWRGYPVGRGLDAVAFGAPVAQAIGRLGDLVNGEHIAKATGLPWGVTYTDPDSPAFAHSLTVGPHHPATTYELLGDLAIFALVALVAYRVFRRRPGLTFFVYLVGYAVMRFFLTYLRVDSAELLGLRVPQVISILVVLAAIAPIWYFATRPQEPAPPPPPPSPPGRVPVRG